MSLAVFINFALEHNLLRDIVGNHSHCGTICSTLSKKQILEAYLNTIYLSNGCYGVKTAAETYFGKEVSDLNVAEAASIAAITQYPSKYDPLNEPENNRKRQIDVLYSMKDKDLKYLTEDEYQQAKAYEMIFTISEVVIRICQYL